LLVALPPQRLTCTWFYIFSGYEFCKVIHLSCRGSVILSIRLLSAYLNNLIRMKHYSNIHQLFMYLLSLGKYIFCYLLTFDWVSCMFGSDQNPPKHCNGLSPKIHKLKAHIQPSRVCLEHSVPYRYLCCYNCCSPSSYSYACRKLVL
jgi:hypothetical protein